MSGLEPTVRRLSQQDLLRMKAEATQEFDEMEDASWNLLLGEEVRFTLLGSVELRGVVKQSSERLLVVRPKDSKRVFLVPVTAVVLAEIVRVVA